MASLPKLLRSLYDGGVNYRFKDLGKTTEVVTYKGEKGLDAAKFIATNVKERIKAEYTGGKPYTIYIADGDKKQLPPLSTWQPFLAIWKT